jgi:hypothetical protein
MTQVMNSLDRNGDGTIDPKEFESLFAKKDPQLLKDPGIRNLTELEFIDLSGNSISSLKVGSRNSLHAVKLLVITAVGAASTCVR